MKKKKIGAYRAKRLPRLDLPHHVMEDASIHKEFAIKTIFPFLNNMKDYQIDRFDVHTEISFGIPELLKLNLT